MTNAIQVRQDDAVVRKTARTRKCSVWNLAAGRAVLLLLLLLISLIATAVTDPDDGSSSSLTEDPGKAKIDSSIADITKTIDLLNGLTERRAKTAKSIIEFPYKEIRNQVLNNMKIPPSWSKGIMYWMYRDHRVQDNWALLYAQKLALIHKVPLHVIYCKPNSLAEVSLRQHNFMIQGLKQVQTELKRLNIYFHFSYVSAVEIISNFVFNHNLGAIIVDFMPLRDYTSQTRRLATVMNHKVPVIMVDAHNVVPCWSHTRINGPPPLHVESKYKDFLSEFPPVIKHPYNSTDLLPEPIVWEEIDEHFNIDRTVLPVPKLSAGYTNGIVELENYMKNKLENPESKDSSKFGFNNLTPWLHFGQVSPQRVMLELNRFEENYLLEVDTFLSDVYKRRERSDLYCYKFPHNYDRLDGAPHWARSALSQHRLDERPRQYPRHVLEQAKTADKLWNAVQLQIIAEGWTHRLMRTYWVKKILEWTDTPENALANAIHLYNKYALDAGDPTFYNGIQYAICTFYVRPSKPNTRRLEKYVDIAWYRRKIDIEALMEKYNSDKHSAQESSI